MFLFFFFKQKTAYEMRISDWSSDVCSSDLSGAVTADRHHGRVAAEARGIGCGPSEGVLGIVPSRWIGILRCEPILHRHNNRFGLVRHQPHRPVRSRDAADRKTVV